MNAHQTCPEIADADFKILDSDWFKLYLAQPLAGTHKEKLRFCIVYLESVGDHPSLNFCDTLLGRFAVFSPSQCWCARFGELTSINNIGRTRRRARSRNSVGWKAPNYFCLRLKLGLLRVHHLKEMSTMAWRTNTAGYHLHTYGY